MLYQWSYVCDRCGSNEGLLSNCFGIVCLLVSHIQMIFFSVRCEINVNLKKLNTCCTHHVEMTLEKLSIYNWLNKRFFYFLFCCSVVTCEEKFVFSHKLKLFSLFHVWKNAFSTFYILHFISLGTITLYVDWIMYLFCFDVCMHTK